MTDTRLTLTLDDARALDAVADCIAQLRYWAREARKQPQEVVASGDDCSDVSTVVTLDNSGAPEPVSQPHSGASTSNADHSQRLVHGTTSTTVGQAREMA